MPSRNSSEAPPPVEMWLILLPQAVEKVREAGECMGKAFPEVKEVMHAIKEKFEDVCGSNTGVEIGRASCRERV